MHLLWPLMDPESKTNAVLALPVAPPIDLAALGGALIVAFRSHLLALTGDVTRDLIRVEMTLDVSGWGVRFEGFGAHDRRRLDLVAVVEPADRAIEVALVVTKSDTVADLERPIFGFAGPDIGNAVLVARLVDAAIPVLVAGGVNSIRNHPIDERVRAIYRRMGFANGEVLDLRDAAALGQVFADAARACARYGLSLGAMAP